MQHFIIRDGEIVETPRLPIGFLTGLSLALLTVLLGLVIAVQVVGL